MLLTACYCCIAALKAQTTNGPITGDAEVEGIISGWVGRKRIPSNGKAGYLGTTTYYPIAVLTSPSF